MIPNELTQLMPAIHAAGRAIIEVRDSITVTSKDDKSPVTEADLRSDAILLEAVRRLWPEIPVVTEESGLSEGSDATRFFLIDPLDGTKEFINKRTDFTVNVGLIDGTAPGWGIVYAPALDVVFAGVVGKGAWRGTLVAQQDYSAVTWEPIQIRKAPKEGLAAVVSRSHLDPETENILSKLTIADKVEAGSSLKFCRVAEGSADIYPRVGRTMEWDTAAADAVLRAAGGTVFDLAGKPLAYRKPDFANAGFVAWGDKAA